MCVYFIYSLLENSRKEELVNRRAALILGCASRRIMERRICETPGGAVRLVNLRAASELRARALGNAGLPARKITGKWNGKRGGRKIVHPPGASAEIEKVTRLRRRRLHLTYVSLSRARARSRACAWTFFLRQYNAFLVRVFTGEYSYPFRRVAATSDWRAETFSRRYSLGEQPYSRLFFFFFYSQLYFTSPPNRHIYSFSSARVYILPLIRRRYGVTLFPKRHNSTDAEVRDSTMRKINGVNGNTRNRVYEKKRKRFIYREYEDTITLSAKHDAFLFRSVHPFRFTARILPAFHLLPFASILPSRTAMYLVLRFSDSRGSERKLPD